jgi:hypothetical protein
VTLASSARQGPFTTEVYMSDFLAAVLAKAAVMLVEVLVVRLLQVVVPPTATA